MNPVIRSGENCEGPRIKELLEKSGFPVLNVKWDKIEPCWIVAEIDEEIVGAITVGFGLPIGRIEMLCLDNSLSRISKARCAKLLFEYAKISLKEMGSKVVMALISDDNEYFQDLCEHHGAKPIDAGKLMIYYV